MNENIKRFVLIPVLLVLISVALIWVTGAWKFFKWIQFREVSYALPQLLDIYENPFIIDCDRNVDKLNDLSKFLKEHPDDPEYLCGYAFLSEKRQDFITNMQKAEQLDKSNPAYPYFLGLGYGGYLTGLHGDTVQYPPESILVALSRAEKLDPQNAAIVLAKLNALVEVEDTPTRGSYRKLRDGPNGDHSTTYSQLTDEGREVIKSAMSKSYYESYFMQASSYFLKLLKDSGNDDFFTRINYLATCPIQRFIDESRGLKLYIENIGPFNNKERIEATADTIINLAQLGFMMTEDPNRTLIQNMIGLIFMKIELDLLGDLYFVNNMPSSERVVGLLLENEFNWRVMWGESRVGNGRVMGFSDMQLVAIGAAVGLFSPIALLLILFIVGIVGSLVSGTVKEKVKLGATGWEVLFLMIFFAIVTEGIFFIGSEGFEEIGLFISGIIIIIGLIFLLISIFKRKIASIYTVFIFVIIIGLSGLITSLLYQAILEIISLPLLIGILLGFIGSAIVASRETERKWSAFWAVLTKISANTFIFLALVLLVAWAITGSQLNAFMEMEKANYKLDNVGPQAIGAGFPIRSYEPGAHFIPNDGDYSDLRETRLEKLEKLFNKSFEK